MLWQAGTRSRGSWDAGTPSKPNRNFKNTKYCRHCINGFTLQPKSAMETADDYTLEGWRIKQKLKMS